MKLIRILIVLLAAQLFFIILSLRTPEVKIAEKILTLSNNIDRIEIEADKKKLVLLKVDSSWKLDLEQGFPADTSRVDSIIKRLLDLETGISVARTDASRKQLKVADDNFERAVTLSAQGKEEAKVYFGSSPIFKRVYLRKSNSEEIYDASINAYEFSADSSDWHDRKLLKFVVDQVNEFSINSILISKKDQQFIYDNEELSLDQVKTLLTRITNISFLEWLKEYSDKEFNKLVKVADVQVKFGNKNIQFHLSGPYETDYYVMKISELPYYLKVNKASLDFIKEFTVEPLKKTSDS